MRETESLAHFKTFLPLFIIFLCSKIIFSQEYPQKEIDALLKSGIESIVNQDYGEASKIFLRLDRNYPEIPLGKIYSAAVEIAKSYDYGADFNSEFINEKLDQAVKASDKLLEENPEYAWNIYFSALAEGYYAYYKALERNFLSALNNGYSAMIEFEKCLSIDSSFYDAYTAIGVYKYWKSRKTEFINWLPFVKDEREEGIKDLITSLDHFTYNKHLAANSLVWIYIDKKEFDKAIQAADKMLKLHPANRQFKWGLARAYEGINREKSISIYYDILGSYRKLDLPNQSREITLLHIIAQQYEKIGNKAKALEICRNILNSNLSSETKEKLGKRFSRIQEMERSLSQEE
jgi:tetratricopeptide (TPR) repeat protein